MFEELKPITADDDQAGYMLRFSPTGSRIDPLNTNPTRPANIIRNALRVPRVVAVRVLDRRGSGSNSGVIAGVEYVAANGAPGDVANMSLGGGVSQALDDAVVTAASGGVKFALAAGNESDNANNHSPARANGPNVYTVSAFANGNVWASYSNFGNPPIDYAEPGSAIKSTWLSGGYNTISGTSMATPHLAGILLARATPANGGVVSGDPDGNPDTIGTH